MRVEQVRVLGATGTDLAEIVRQVRLQHRERLSAFYPHRSEMAHVEAGGPPSARQMLCDRAGGVRQGHLPAAEVDETGAEGFMLGSQWRVAEAWIAGA